MSTLLLNLPHQVLITVVTMKYAMCCFVSASPGISNLYLIVFKQVGKGLAILFDSGLPCEYQPLLFLFFPLSEA